MFGCGKNGKKSTRNRFSFFRGRQRGRGSIGQNCRRAGPEGKGTLYFLVSLWNKRAEFGGRFVRDSVFFAADGRVWDGSGTSSPAARGVRGYGRSGALVYGSASCGKGGYKEAVTGRTVGEGVSGFFCGGRYV